MEKDHCEGHSGTLALLQEHSKAIADLYDKHDDTMLLLNEIKLCTATMAMKLDNGFEQANNKPVVANLSNEITGTMISNTIKDAVAATASLRTLGTGATQAMPGNHVPPPPAAIAGNYLIVGADAEVVKSGTSWQKAKEIIMPRGGTFRIRFGMMRYNTNYNAYGRIYRNGSPIGTERVNTVGGPSGFVTYTEDIGGWKMGDLCQLYLRGQVSVSSTAAAKFRLYEGNIFARAHVTLD